MLNKLIKAVNKRNNQVNQVCSQLDSLQAKALKSALGSVADVQLKND